MGAWRGPLGREELLSQAAILEGRAARLSLGSAEERWEATAVLRDAAAKWLRALEAQGTADGDTSSWRRERASARVEACRLFLAAKDPVRAMHEWARLPREAFSPEAGAPADAVKPEYGALIAAFSRAYRDVLGPEAAQSLAEVRPDQLRALLDTYPGVPELWWALARCTDSAGEAELARARVRRLNPALEGSGLAEAAFRAIEPNLVFRFRVDLVPELRSGRLTLDLAARIITALSDLLTSFGESTTGVTPELLPGRAPGHLAGARHFALEIGAWCTHPFALEDLDRDLQSTVSRSAAGARVALLSLLQEHRIRLTASPLAPCDQAGLMLDEGRRATALDLATAAALAQVDSRDIPQADDVERVFRIVERVAKGKGDPTDISPRQISYYRRAAKILGFLDENEALTPGGHLVTRLEREHRLRVAAVRFESSACGGAWIRWSGGRTLLDVDPATAVDFLRSSVPGLGKDTCERRAQTLVAWHRALVAHHYAKGGAPRESKPT